MSCSVFLRHSTSEHRYSAVSLFCTFIFGFFAGALIVSSNVAQFTLQIRSAAISPTSSIGLLTQIFFSCTATLLLCKTGRGYLFLLSFVQALTFGIATTAIYYAYGSARWLVHALMLFTRTITLISLFWFWLRIVSGQSHSIFQDFLFTLCVSVLAAVFDVYLISPILLKLFLL